MTQTQRAPAVLDKLYPRKREVRLTSGHHVTIEPWGIEAGMSLLPTLVEMMEGLGGDLSDQSVAKLILENRPGAVLVIARTLGWTEAEVDERLSLEDLFTVGQAILEVCVITPTGDGLLGKLLRLARAVKGGPTPTTPETPSAAPSSS